MRKKFNQKEAQPSCHQVAEPAVAYGLQTNATALLDVDDETMSIEEARKITHATVHREYALGRDMTPEELYDIIAEEIDVIYTEA